MNGSSRSKTRSQEAKATGEWEDLFSHILVKSFTDSLKGREI